MVTVSWEVMTKLYREIFVEMLDSIHTPFPECIKLVCDNITLDPYFKDFYAWAKENGVPVVIVSSGMLPVIKALLEHLLGPAANEIDIIANDTIDRPGKSREEADGWTIQFRDESGFGHDKSRSLRPYAEHFNNRPNEVRPTLLYAGDGVSDLSAARETDLLFAKKGHGKSLTLHSTKRY